MIEFDADADDDAHFCLKCHLTIIGLDNYVTHKKSGCAKSTPGISKSPLPSQILPPDEIGLKADDFFSSLELRSSSKKPTTQNTTVSAGKNFSRILTRSKTTAVIQATTISKEHPSDQQSPSDLSQSKSGKNVWIGGDQLKELGHGDNQSKLIKAVDNLERRKEELLKIEVFDESDEDSEEFVDYDDESTDDDDDQSRQPTGGKWKPQSPIQWSSRDKDWGDPQAIGGGKWKPGAGKRALSPNYTKGKWKLEPKEVEIEVDPNVPPPTYTGSKWIPLKKQDYRSSSTLGFYKNKWKMKSENEDEGVLPNVKGKCKSKSEELNSTSTSTPSHGRGKSKTKTVNDDIQGSQKNQSKVKVESKNEEANSLPPNDANQTKEIPPITYTKGKWKPKIEGVASPATQPKTSEETQSADAKPKNKNFKITDDSPFRKSSGTVQYWCSPCNRRLASKIVYERHLRSDLHFKRTRPEREFDEGAFISKKRKVRAEISVNKVVKTFDSNKKRKRKKIYESCTVCQSRVNKTMMGKHLISHYHCRRGDTSSETATKMVLENIKAIILESPFQCCVCSFYCNTHDQFLLHWRSDFHNANDRKYDGYFLCIFCKFTCKSSDEMLAHLNCVEHSDVVSVINRSVPITIKKINEILCLTCNQKFTLNIHLLNHCRKANHDSSNVNIFSKDAFYCKDCKKYFYTALSMQRHRKKVHKHEYFYCSTCNLKFGNTLEAKKHRRSQIHRYTMLERVKPPGASLRRKCEYCAEYFNNFLLLKNHLREKHPEHKIRCPHCGVNFVVTQELTNHLRSKSCKIEGPPASVSTNRSKLQCDKCAFTAEASSELWFHVALHDEPILMYPLDEDGNAVQIKPLPRYKCPICQKIFPKSSLRDHIKQHTQERPHVCKICGSTFARKNNWLYHTKKHQCKRTCQIVKKVDGKPFLCATCGAGFAKRATLHQHMTIHTGKPFKCTEDGCFYTGRKISELKDHSRIHSNSRDFSCHLCDYKGKTKGLLKKHVKNHGGEKKFQCSVCAFTTKTSGHLKRHLRLHTGVKPFSCPHCEYKCNNYENLRKHVISTAKHPGKSIFECKFCEDSLFNTNYAKEFRIHLMTVHAKSFPDSKEAASYVASIYESSKDSQVTDDVVDYLDDERVDRSTIPQSSKSADTPRQIYTLKTQEDPLFTTEQTTKDKVLEQILPMFVIPKDESGSNEIIPDSWNLVGRFDVEESGTLVPFQSEGDVLFQEHF